MYKLDTLLLKQKRFPVLDKTGFIFRIRTRVFIRTSSFTGVRMQKKKPVLSNTGSSFF
jgi:hypothetical protein